MTRRLLTSVVDEVCCLVSSGCVVVASVLRLAPIVPSHLSFIMAIP
jgi:hypothetical protein